MVGELSEVSDLYGVLGRLYSRQTSDEHREEARSAFLQAHKLGSSKTDSYYHWIMMEKNIAESMSHQDGEFDYETVAKLWNTCERIAEMGIERCGKSQLLCYWAGLRGQQRGQGSRARTELRPCTRCVREVEG